jgi:dipeptidyl aminopeptidase/acylaminoacyl peptidase
MDAEFAALGTSGVMGATNAPTSAESKYLGKTIGTPEAQPLVVAASPRTYISADDPPMLIQHGTKDRNIPITQSIDFAAGLAAAIGKDKVYYETIEGAGHGGSQFETAANIAKVLDFLDKHLK